MQEKPQQQAKKANAPNGGSNIARQNGQSENIPAETNKEKEDKAAAAARRKSNCVKEVERIKKEREERRAQQIAKREQHDKVYDTSQPNWQFAAMIE